MQDIENLSRNVLDRWDFSSCVNLCRFLRTRDLHHLNRLISTYFLKVLGTNVDLLDELGISLWYLKIYRESFDVYSRAIEIPNINEKRFAELIFNQHFSSEVICDNQCNLDKPEGIESYTTYPTKIVESITGRAPIEIQECLVTFTITTCKRVDLFYKTINSFLNCVIDLDRIGEWYIIDDHSSQEDLNDISRLYPFFRIISKTPSQKGHPHSMNIIREIVKTPFLFHMEDDWLFYRKFEYIKTCLDVITSDSRYGQCLVNLNYSELPSDNITGGIFQRTMNSTAYYKHEYYPNQEDMPEKFKGVSNCAYWPHFSFRPSLLNTRIFREVGEFNVGGAHFEMEYAHRYVSHGFISCFLPHISCKHIGRLTSERHDTTKANAYQLNGESQFTKVKDGGFDMSTPKTTPKTTPKIKNFVVNLDRRQDRWHKFLEKCENIPLEFNRFSAVDGAELKPTRQLYRLFDTNDYNFRRGMVGCALSHLQLMINLLYDEDCDAYFILEDDVDFSEKFYQKYIDIIEKLCISGDDWGILYLGHTPYPEFSKEWGEGSESILKKISASESLQKSMGGAFGYLINKRGATKVLEYVAEHGMTNAIDTMQQKSADMMGGIHYSVPGLLFSRVAHQSDIQNNFNTLYLTQDAVLQLEVDFLRGRDVEYEVTDRQKGVGWRVYQGCHISINLSDIDKVSDMLYPNRIKKIVKDSVIYTVSDCIEYN